MNSEPSVTEASPERDASIDPTLNTYDDTLEGQLQYYADLSLWYAAQSKSAKTHVKRDYFKKKQLKNNNKLYRLLVRTPNLYNPLMKYLTPPRAEESDTVTSGYSHVEGTELPADGVLTTTAKEGDDIVYHEAMPPLGVA